MFRSISRCTVAAAFVLALVLSTAPAQALPGNFGSSFGTSDASWFDVALGWLEGLLGGGDAELHSLETEIEIELGTGGTGGTIEMNSGSCLDPLGNPCGDNG